MSAKQTLSVHLADAPTDVLVYLVEQADCALSLADLAAAVAPPGVHDPLGTTANALALLSEMGYAYFHMGVWSATREGIDAIAEASANAPSQRA